MQEFLSRENAVRGTLLFILCTVAGLSLSFLWSGSEDVKHVENIKRVFLEMRIEMLIGACLCMFVDWLFGALRFHVFIRKVFPAIRFRDSLRANLATLCVSAITPFQTGGVGHLYIYARAGVPLSGAITSGIICFLATLITLALGAGGIIWVDPPFLPKGTTWVSLFSFVIFGVVLVAFLLLLLSPEIIFRLFHWLCDVVRRRFSRLASILERVTSKVEQLVTEHKAFATMFLRNHKGTCVLSILLTCGFFGARIVVGYMVMKALNGDATLWELSVVGIVLNFVVLFAPSPGASGVAEIVTDALMKGLILKESIPLYVLLTRFFTIYSAVIAGGILISLQLGKDFGNNKKEMAKDVMSQSASGSIRELPDGKGRK